MFANDIKKGSRIQLYDGTEGTVMDKQKGNIRTIKVPQWSNPKEHDVGSSYIRDWAFVYVEPPGVWQRVQLTPKQIANARAISAMGF